MKMYHMVADTIEELHAMAETIGLNRKWVQGPETTGSKYTHYDIASFRKKIAIKHGAIQVERESEIINVLKKQIQE